MFRVGLYGLFFQLHIHINFDFCERRLKLLQSPSVSTIDCIWCQHQKVSIQKVDLMTYEECRCRKQEHAGTGLLLDLCSDPQPVPAHCFLHIEQDDLCLYLGPVKRHKSHETSVHNQNP